MALDVTAVDLAAQNPTPAPAATDENPAFKTRTEETVLDVVVRYKKGRLVKDLKESDVTVTDNGQARPIKSFRVVEGTEAVKTRLRFH